MKKHFILTVVALAIVASGCTKSNPSANPAETPPVTTTPGTTAPSGQGNGTTQTPSGGTTTPNAGNTGGQAPAAPTTTPSTTPSTPAATSPSGGTSGTVQAAPPPPKPIVTPKQFDEVTFGMSYADVQKITGQTGQVENESVADGVAVKTYVFKLKDGANMKVTFKNDKVLSKSTSN